MTDYDSPWKEALDVYFQPFLELFFAQAHSEIDWSRGTESLDKELQQIVREAELGRRFVDKLVKVWLKTGREQWVLIHVEVQSSEDGKFALRMYVYNYRLFDKGETNAFHKHTRTDRITERAETGYRGNAANEVRRTGTPADAGNTPDRGSRKTRGCHAGH
jgi:hypothetical protein